MEPHQRQPDEGRKAHWRRRVAERAAGIDEKLCPPFEDRTNGWWFEIVALAEARAKGLEEGER